MTDEVFDFLLAHQRADFLGRAVALGLERFNLGECLASYFVGPENSDNISFIPCPARGESLADKVRLVANQFNVEHREIIGVKLSAARLKAGGHFQQPTPASPSSTVAADVSRL